MAATRVALVGMMGSGKSTVGRELAASLGVRFVDLDALVVERTGRAIADIFATDGEPAFRSAEVDALTAAFTASSPGVIACGGGIVETATARELLADPAIRVVWLDAPTDVLSRRVGDGASRPMLSGRPVADALAELSGRRSGWYGEVADLRIDTTDRSPADIATEIARWLDGIRTVHVPLADRSYPVLVGDGARHHLAHLMPANVRRVAIVTQAKIPVEVDPGVEHRVFTIADGEAAKELATIEELCRGFAAWGMTRADAVVAVGGGVVTDVGGFAAAVYHRGIPVVHVATTLLGQVDAAIGGKTGVNLPEGKNLVGAFWQPSGVICDTEVLATLPARERRCGFGELAKYHFIGGADLAELPLVDKVARAVQIKAEVVAADEREGGRRAILNYGHTLAHALEIAGRFDLRHGEAVAIGLVYAAEVATRLGRIHEDAVAHHRHIVASYDLPATLPAGADPDELLALMARDKKALIGLTFVLDGPRGVETVTDVPEDVLRASLEALR
jgi:5-deoxy-5-amino-3-dehydroquinate synthase